VVTDVFTTEELSDLILPPEGGGTAKYDIDLWGWSGGLDPQALLVVFTCDEIGNLSDSQYCNPAYDKLYNQQLKEVGEARTATLARMQNLIYDEAPYDILYYGANLDAWRTDRFAGWQNMPPEGTPFFTYGNLNYTRLTKAQPTPASQSAPAATGGPSASASGAPANDGGSTSGSGTNTILFVVVAGLAILAVSAGFIMRRRSSVSGNGERRDE
jgi:peptide/nickel transport system substrate-binding protein